MNSDKVWTKIDNVSSLVTIIAGIASIGQFAFAVAVKLKMGVPFWLIITLSFSWLLCGWFLGIWVQNRRSRFGATIREVGKIRFDYLPDSPIKHGWQLDFDSKTQPEQRKAPQFFAVHSAPIPGSLSIVDNGRYSLNHTIGQVQSLANLVEYCIKPARHGTFYLRVTVRSRDGSQTRNVWLRHVIGTGIPCQINPSEWSFDVKGELLEDGWVLVKLSMEDEVARSYGSQGYVFQNLLSVRFRGSLSISPISFFRVESLKEIGIVNDAKEGPVG